MNIPANAKRVFKGIIFDVYQWQQKMFDGSYSTFEMLKRPSTVEVIAIMNGRIYVSHQSQPNKKDFYSLAGGRSEAGETPLETAKRELLEEFGMASDHWELLKTYHPQEKIDWDISLYVAKDCKKISEQQLDAGEQIELKELSFDEFIKVVLSEKYWGDELVLDILKMMQAGTLPDFKKTLNVE